MYFLSLIAIENESERREIREKSGTNSSTNYQEF